MTSPRRGRHAAGVPMAVEAALVLPALAAGLGLGRLGTAPGALQVVAPIGVAVLAGQGATAAAARRLGAVAGAIAGAVGVGLVSVWWFLPSHTAWGVPTGATADAAGERLREAWALIRAEPTPVHAVPAIVLCMALGAGLGAVCARSLLTIRSPGRRRNGTLSPMLALAPTAVLFGYASLLDSGSDRAQAALTYAGTVALFALAAGRTRRATGSFTASVEAGRPQRRVGSPPLLFATGLAAALIVPLLVAPSLSSMRPRPFVASAGGGLGTGSTLVPFSGIIDSSSLVDDVGAVLQQRPHQLLFVARSPVPTYWQVATLTTYEGGRWLADPETAAAVEGTPLPGTQLPQLPQPAATSFYDASVTVENMQSDLLPVPPAAVAVTGAGIRLVPGLGARLLSGSSYLRTYGVHSAAGSRPATRAPSGAELAPYLHLPRVDPEVVAVTRRIASGVRSPLAKAEALAAFFARGGFRYSLDVEIPGPDPLVGFLFRTKTGFCQQFAGAYAVMARLAGLPTRVAVGFTAGAAVSGAFRITGADAHVWPEVYLGRRLGWVSVDPTPAAPGVVTTPAPEVLVANVAAGVGAGEPPLARPAQHGSAPSDSAAPPAPTASAAVRAPTASGTHGSSVAWWPVGALGFLLLVLVPGRARLAARARRARWRRLPPQRAVVALWQDAANAMGRRPHETPDEHATRVAPHLDGHAAAFVELARLAAWAGYSGEVVTADHCATARRLHAGATRR